MIDKLRLVGIILILLGLLIILLPELIRRFPSLKAEHPMLIYTIYRKGNFWVATSPILIAIGLVALIFYLLLAISRAA